MASTTPSPKGALRRYYEESLRFADGGHDADPTFLGMLMAVGFSLFFLVMWLFLGSLTLPLFLPPRSPILSMASGDAQQPPAWGSSSVGAC